MPSYKELMLKRKKKADSIQNQLRIEQLSSGKRPSPKPDITEEQLRAALAKKNVELPPLDTGDYSHIEEGRREIEKDRLANEKAYDDYWERKGWQEGEDARRYGEGGDRIRHGATDFIGEGESTIYKSATKGATLQLEKMKNELEKIANTEEGLLTAKEIYAKHKDKFDEFFEAEDGMNALRDSYQLQNWSTIDPKRDFYKKQNLNPWDSQLVRMGVKEKGYRYPSKSGKGHGVMPDAVRKNSFIDKALRRGWIDRKKLNTGRLAELRNKVFKNYPSQRQAKIDPDSGEYIRKATPRGYGNALYNKLIKAPLAKHDLGNLKEPPPMPSVTGSKLKIPEPVMPSYTPPTSVPIDPQTGLPVGGGGGNLKILKPNK